MDTIPAFQKAYDFYKNLYLNLRQIPKQDRFTWGERCEETALEILRDVAQATYATSERKRSLLIQTKRNIDMAKIYLRLGSDLRILDQKKYVLRQDELQELGKMVGGWVKSI